MLARRQRHVVPSGERGRRMQDLADASPRDRGDGGHCREGRASERGPAVRHVHDSYQQPVLTTVFMGTCRA